MHSPCQGCPERHEGCHGQCEKYQEFRADRDAFNAARQEAKRGTPAPPRLRYNPNHCGNMSGWENLGNVNARRRQWERERKGGGKKPGGHKNG